MKIGLIGYGKMGKEIERIARERNHEFPLIIDIDNASDLNTPNLKKVDVVIDFSTPQSAFENIKKCFEAGVPIVSGTTGWIEKLDEAKKICAEEKQTLFWASNYSLGVNLFFKLNEQLAKMMSQMKEYHVSMTEVHHVHKLDKPSGTAISLAQGIIKNSERLNNWCLAPENKTGSVSIDAVRRDEVPGIHTITYNSPVDFIEITHSAKNRHGFALGAAMAAEFIKDKKGFYSMEDLLSILCK